MEMDELTEDRYVADCKSSDRELTKKAKFGLELDGDERMQGAGELHAVHWKDRVDIIKGEDLMLEVGHLIALSLLQEGLIHHVSIAILRFSVTRTGPKGFERLHAGFVVFH